MRSTIQNGSPLVDRLSKIMRKSVLTRKLNDLSQSENKKFPKLKPPSKKESLIDVLTEKYFGEQTLKT
jgi:hypothetical protein